MRKKGLNYSVDLGKKPKLSRGAKVGARSEGGEGGEGYPGTTRPQGVTKYHTKGTMTEKRKTQQHQKDRGGEGGEGGEG